MGTAAPTRRLSLSLGSHTRQIGGLLPLSSPSIPVSSPRAALSIVPLPPSAPATHEVSPPRLPSERLDVPVAQVARNRLDYLVVNVAPPERLEGLNDGAGYGRAVEKASVGPAPQINWARTVAVRLVGAAAHIHVARRNLVVKPQRIERRAARVKRTPRT